MLKIGVTEKKYKNRGCQKEVSSPLFYVKNLRREAKYLSQDDTAKQRCQDSTESIQL